MSNRLPQKIIDGKLATEEIYIIPPKELNNMQLHDMQIAKDYYEKCFIKLCGTQVWDILDNIKAIRERLHLLKNPPPPPKPFIPDIFN